MNIIKQAHKLLINKKKTIAIAESCTGGIISTYLTSMPGSSKYFILALTAYSNKAKEKILKVPHSIINKKGAVSKEVAELMAKNIRRISKADFGISTTGIAGPTGATVNKPVGTVFVCLAANNFTQTKKLKLKGSRHNIRIQASKAALKLLKKYI